MTRRGLQKHLLGSHQLVFHENSMQTRSLNASELEDAMQRLHRGQFHNRPRTVFQPKPDAGRQTPTVRVQSTNNSRTGTYSG